MMYINGQAVAPVVGFNPKEVEIASVYISESYLQHNASEVYNNYIQNNISPTYLSGLSYIVAVFENNSTNNYYIVDMTINVSGTTISPDRFRRWRDGSYETLSVTGTTYAAYIAAGTTMKIIGYKE